MQTIATVSGHTKAESGTKILKSVPSPEATITFYSGKASEVIYPNYTLKSAEESKPELRDLMIKR